MCRAFFKLIIFDKDVVYVTSDSVLERAIEGGADCPPDCTTWTGLVRSQLQYQRMAYRLSLHNQAGDWSIPEKLSWPLS